MFAPVLSINTPGAIRVTQEGGNSDVRQNHKHGKPQILEPMKTIKMGLLPGTAAFAAINWAACIQAQSFLPDYYVTPHYGASDHSYLSTPTGKVYLGFDGGAAFQQPINLYDSIGDKEKVTFDTGARLDLELGCNVTPNWALELEMGLIINQVKNSFVLGTDFMNVDLVEFPVMANVIYTRPLGHNFSVYLGGGLGGVFSDYENEFGETTEGDTTFAFQGLAGLKYTFGDRWDVGVTYKFLGTTKHDVGSGFDSLGNPTEFKSDGTMTHSVLLALSCRF
jgi:opacity protein-like surface antigen